MHRRISVALALVLLATALPLSASQFLKLPFDQVAREAKVVVRGTVVNTYSAWDEAHETIFTYSTVRVKRYISETTGPDVLMVREAGGTVGNYTQQAIGFPELRDGEEVVLLLTKWDDSDDWRIHAYNQGKFLVRTVDQHEMLTEDPVKQGDERFSGERLPAFQIDSALEMREFEQMVTAAREGRAFTPNYRN